MANRIKGLYKKQSGSFGVFKPFGTDGTLVDMLSGLDNEQELKLGGNHTSTIVESVNDQEETITTITEKYKDKTNNSIIYTLKTEITEHDNGSTTIVSTLYSGNDTTVTPLNVKTITIPLDGTTDFTIEEVLS